MEWFNTFEILLQNIENEEKEFLVLGDLNCDLLREIKSTQTKKFLDLINLYQQEQLIKEPTRITETTETLIDVIITNNQEQTVKSGVIHLGISDHCFIYACWKISFARNRSKTIQSRNFKFFNT